MTIDNLLVSTNSGSTADVKKMTTRYNLTLSSCKQNIQPIP